MVIVVCAMQEVGFLFTATFSGNTFNNHNSWYHYRLQQSKRKFYINNQ